MNFVSRLLLLVTLAHRAAGGSAHLHPDGHQLSPQPAEEDRHRAVKALEKGFLNMMGMSSFPSHRVRPVVPEFMVDLYEERVSGVLSGRASRSRLPHLRSASTVRSFAHLKSEYIDDSSNSVILSFKMDYLPPNEVLLGAEFRVYRKELSALLLPNDTHRYRIDVLQIMKMIPSSKSSNSSSSSKSYTPITRLLDTKVVSPFESMWESFDISPAGRLWAAHPKARLYLQVRCTRLDNSSSSHGFAHVRVTRSPSRVSHSEWQASRPHLVAYLHDPSHPQRSVEHSRVKRRAGGKNGKKKKERKAKRTNSVCSRNFLYVSFKDVGWNTWIVAPQGYTAYYCEGRCPFILTPHLNASNHAVIQNLVNAVNPNVVPKPCCVPTELLPMSMLYFGRKGDVILKEYEDMVVDACGCR